MDVWVLFPLVFSISSIFNVCGAIDARRPGGTEKISPHMEPFIKRFQLHFLARPQREECFYQHGYEGNHLVLHYQVMDDAGTVRYREKNPTGQETFTELDTRGHRTIEVKEDGEHQFCFINLKRPGKRVHIMLSVVDRNLQRQLYGESSDVPEEYQAAWNATIELLYDVNTMYGYIFQGRRRGWSDSQLVKQNGQFVAYWSMAQCCVIVLAGVAQVYALRTMFRTVSVTPTNKPRS